jgi:hypothetical protein
LKAGRCFSDIATVRKNETYPEKDAPSASRVTGGDTLPGPSFPGRFPQWRICDAKRVGNSAFNGSAPSTIEGELSRSATLGKNICKFEIAI